MSHVAQEGVLAIFPSIQLSKAVALSGRTPGMCSHTSDVKTPKKRIGLEVRSGPLLLHIAAVEHFGQEGKRAARAAASLRPSLWTMQLRPRRPSNLVIEGET